MALKKNKKKKLSFFLIGILIGVFLCAVGVYAATSIYSVNVTYDSTSSSLSSSTVQDAIDELYGMCRGSRKISTYITSLFSKSSQTSVTTAGGEAITQASSVGLMEDSDGNIRYYGESPNNYVLFNDELWRIIGVFEVEDEDGNVEQRVKIMRNEYVVRAAYDNKLSGLGTSENDYGSNDWSDARLMMLLNPGYEDGATDDDGNTIYEYEGSLYWNSKSGTCYANSGSSTKSCSFTSSGLGDDAKNLIGQAKYYLYGALSGTGWYADDYYAMERGNLSSSYDKVYSGHATEWTGYVGLIYVSDYAYASDLSVCTQDGITYGDDTTNCTGTNWIFQMLASYYMWTITPRATYSYEGFPLIDGNIKGSYYTFNSDGIFPVVYLNADVITVSGVGTESNPYILSTSS